MPVDEMKALYLEIHDLGAKNTVITGLRQKDDQGQETIGFVYFDEQGNLVSSATNTMMKTFSVQETWSH